jgi:predicted signal transduction protein with EAL and GGDEF domain
MQEPFELGGREAYAGMSIGIALFPRDAGERDELMRLADLALYRAKNEGRGRCAFFEARMGDELRLRRTFEEELKLALEQDQLAVVYQPVFDADGRAIVGAEALVRWPHPERGLIPPDQFIGLAEDRGLIAPLGEWVLRRACRDANGWPGIKVAVNVSPIQFRSRDFVATIARLLGETGRDPGLVELELTESVIIENADGAEQAMIELRAMGVSLALDDFGTGYSSLIYLRRFPFDKIKIDRSFLESMEPTGESAIIVESIVSLGRSLGLTVTAEGVETEEQRQILQSFHCHQFQGFALARPMDAAAFGRLLAERRGEDALAERAA